MGCTNTKAAARAEASSKTPIMWTATVSKGADSWGFETEITRSGFLIVSICNHGSLARYNKENALHALRPGDEIVGINGEKESSQMIKLIGQSGTLELEILRKATPCVKIEGDSLVLASSTCQRKQLKGVACVRAEAASSTMCAICLEEYQDPNAGVVELPCRHAFHPFCVLQWFEDDEKRNNRECPLCRQSKESFLREL